MRKANAILFVLFALAFTVFADHHEEKAPAMKPDAMLRQLDYFAGTWQCSGTAYQTPMAPEHPTKGDVVMKWGLDGYWLPFSYTERKTADNPMPFAVNGFLGYDAKAKQLVMGSVDNMGGYSTASSDGWNGDSIVFTGPWHMGAMLVTGRDTFTKKSANEVTHLAEMMPEGGQWMKLGMETCTRK